MAYWCGGGCGQGGSVAPRSASCRQHSEVLRRSAEVFPGTQLSVTFRSYTRQLCLGTADLQNEKQAKSPPPAVAQLPSASTSTASSSDTVSKSTAQAQKAPSEDRTVAATPQSESTRHPARSSSTGEPLQDGEEPVRPEAHPIQSHDHSHKSDSGSGSQTPVSNARSSSSDVRKAAHAS